VTWPAHLLRPMNPTTAQAADRPPCRRIFLREVLLDANIGIHDFERAGSQRLVINVDVFVPLAVSTPRHDRISEVLDYDFVRETMVRRIEQRPHQPAGNAGRRHCAVSCCACIRTWRRCAWRARNPMSYADAEAVGIEVFRHNPRTERRS
jgi:7,8-dihydroneopterin aldolase/epimerase/oxygenase